MSNKAKELRSQMRNVVKELLTEELVRAVEEKLRKEINGRLNVIDQRQKDIAGYMVRQSALPAIKKD